MPVSAHFHDIPFWFYQLLQQVLFFFISDFVIYPLDIYQLHGNPSIFLEINGFENFAIGAWAQLFFHLIATVNSKGFDGVFVFCVLFVLKGQVIIFIIHWYWNNYVRIYIDLYL